MPFISFEGVDGSGKTTQLERVARWLRDLGRTVVSTKEPDGGRIGMDVRTILCTPRDTPLHHVEELLLVSAARYDHVRSVIAPALAAGSWVLADRFMDSTYALQVYGTDTPDALFKAACAAVSGSLDPDLTLILDLPAGAAETRRQQRAAKLDDPAELSRDHARIADGFRHVARNDAGRCRLIDAQGSEEEVFNRLRRAIMEARLD